MFDASITGAKSRAKADGAMVVAKTIKINNTDKILVDVFIITSPF
jgi:hypothetical protein